MLRFHEFYFFLFLLSTGSHVEGISAIEINLFPAFCGNRLQLAATTFAKNVDSSSTRIYVEIIRSKCGSLLSLVI